MTAKPDLLPSSVAAFTEALHGDRGSLDAWLEVHDEREVRAHVEAYARANIGVATAAKDAEIDALRTRLEDTVRDSTNKIEALRAEVSELRAAQIAYANEFPATEDGDPDTGNIHANIRALKVRAERLAEALRHQRWCRTCAEDGWESCEEGRKNDALLRDQEEGK